MQVCKCSCEDHYVPEDQSDLRFSLRLGPDLATMVFLDFFPLLQLAQCYIQAFCHRYPLLDHVLSFYFIKDLEKYSVF